MTTRTRDERTCGRCDGIGHLGAATSSDQGDYGRSCSACEGTGLRRRFIQDEHYGALYSIQVARKRYRCEHGGYECPGVYPICSGWIEPGERYVRASLPPGSDMGNTSWWTLRRHASDIEYVPPAGPGRPSATNGAHV